MTNPTICQYCYSTGFLDWHRDQEKPCPKGCQPPPPATAEQREAYRRRLELLKTQTRWWKLTDTDRHFKKMLFCGAGEVTRAEIEHLITRIDAAMPYLGGRQQGPHWREQPSQGMLDREEALNNEADLVCEQVARDIAMALTGKEITFVEGSE